MPAVREAELEAIRRVAFVTRRFHDLRGLVPATFGAGLLVAMFVDHVSGTFRARSPRQ